MNQYFVLTGMESGVKPFITKFTFTEVALNQGRHKDTELFYTLEAYHTKDIENIELFRPTLVRINRDNNKSIALLTRVDKKTYEEID